MFKRDTKDHLPKAEIIAYFKNFHDKESEYLMMACQLLKIKELTFSFEEIDTFGILYRKNYKKPKKLGFDYDTLLDIFIAYYGHAWMHYFGGKWYDTVEKNDMAHGYCQVIDWGPIDFDWMGIPPHNYAFLIEGGDKDPLSIVIRREINSFTIDGVVNYKIEE